MQTTTQADCIHTMAAREYERKGIEMSSLPLVHFPDKEPTWSSRDRHKTRHNVPMPNENRQVIDYNKLRWLCSPETSTCGRIKSDDKSEESRFFMDNYHQMFFDTKAKPNISLGRSRSATNISTGIPSTFSNVINHDKERQKPEEISHEIKDHLTVLHKERQIADPDIIKKNTIKDLRRILKKLPFERSVEDNKLAFKHLKTFPLVANQVTYKQLKEICAVSILDVWRDEDYTVFGNSGFYIILKGSVLAQTDPWIRTCTNTKQGAKAVTSFLLEKDLPELGVGDCFGCLERIEGQEVNSQVLTVKTKMVPCEFLKISSNDYKRIAQQLKEKDILEKSNLVQPCEMYQLWPRQSLQKLAELIEWTSYPANTVLATEGFICPFIGFIKSGECHVLRQVEVNQTLRNGKEKKCSKQVVMGKLTKSQSFGEISVLEVEAITCSVVTATDVTLGVITPERINELDETTQSLLLQTNERTFGKLSKDDVHTEYINQERQREWNQFKQGVVVNVVNNNGITPGYGKWSKSITE